MKVLVMTRQPAIQSALAETLREAEIDETHK
jgi:hypothetical protein